MSEQIIIEYGAKIDKLQADLRKVEQSQLNLEKGAKKSGKAIKDESDKAGKGVKNVNKEINHLDSSLKKVGGAIAGVFAIGQIIQVGKEIINTTAQFQKFEAVLVNTLGSKSEAQKSLAMIKDFAAKTPFGVAELTDSFVKLANQGFKPTADEMRKLGDIAASQGKSFNQLTEAIIDGQTGEFERLKEFGIRAQKEGDKVKFTFKGVQTQTDFTSDSIQKYILGLGDAVGVSGSMAAISGTVGGQLSNLDDSFDSLYNTIGSGNSSVISGAIALLDDLVKGLELSLTTADQLKKRFKQQEASSRENFALASLEQEINVLKQKTDSEAEARRLIYANEILYLEKYLKDRTETLEYHQKSFGEFLSDPQKEILEGFQEDIDYTEGMIKKLAETISKIDKDDRGPQKTKADLEKEFKLRLDMLKKQEDMAVRRAELEDKTEGQIINIHKNYNGQRIELFKRYEKEKEIEYKEFFLIAQELEKEHTEWLKKEEEKRQAEIIKHRDEILSIMDKSFKDEENQTRAVYNDQLTDLGQRYMQGMITKADFEQQSNDMILSIQKEGIKDEIDLINAKLAIGNLSYEQRVDLEGALIDKRKELNNIELEDFKKKEDEKLKIAEEKQRQLQSIVQSGIDLIGQALQGFNDLQLSRELAEIDEERALNDARTKDHLANLGKRKEGGLLTEKQYAQEKARIEKEATKKSNDLKRKQFEAEKKANLSKVAIETAVSVAKTAATAGYPAAIPLIVLALAQGAIQASLISKQPTPKYLSKGEIDINGPGTTTSDSIPARLSKHESVIKAKQSMKHTDALRAIQGDYFDKWVHSNYLPKLKDRERQRAAIKEEREQSTLSWMKSMQANGLVDNSQLERLTKKNNNVSLKNVDAIVSGVGKEFEKAIKNNSYMK